MRVQQRAPFTAHSAPRIQRSAACSACSGRGRGSGTSTSRSSLAPPPEWGQCAAASAAAAVLLLSPLQAAPPAQAAGQAGVSPWDEGKRILLGPTADGRVRTCGINPNCVSTANLDDLFGPPWRSPDTKPLAAAAVLEQAVPAAVPGAELARTLTLADGAEYRAWTVPSLFGEDVLEMVLRPDAPPAPAKQQQEPAAAAAAAGGGEQQQQAAAAASERGVLVTYRSQAGSLKFLYPFQTPITDGGAQKKRLDALRRELGWRVEGCSYLECYYD